MAHAALGEAAARLDVERVGREYFDLFVGVGRGEILPYASYYLTGFLYERPLARLRADLKRLGIERADGQPEPEDSAATLCEIMAGLAGGTLDGAARCRPRHLREAHRAVDGPPVRGPGRSASRRISTPAWARSGRRSWTSRLRRSSSRTSGREEA